MLHALLKIAFSKKNIVMLSLYGQPRTEAIYNKMVQIATFKQQYNTHFKETKTRHPPPRTFLEDSPLQ